MGLSQMNAEWILYTSCHRLVYHDLFHLDWNEPPFIEQNSVLVDTE